LDHCTGDGEDGRDGAGETEGAAAAAVLSESDACIATADTHLASLLRRFPRLLRELTTRQLAMKVFACHRLQVERMVQTGMLTAHHGMLQNRAIDLDLERLIGGEFHARL
jgi:hypothetical protein